MSNTEWHAYIAGFFDGEGSVTIARVRANDRSDYHKIIVGLSQRAKYRQVLDDICADFGGRVSIANERTRVTQKWAQQAKWQLQDKPGITRFLTAIQPYLRVKTQPVALGLEFVGSFEKAPKMRDSLGRIRGKLLSVDEIEHRERLRLAMRAANELGPPRVKPSQLPPLDVQHRAARELMIDPSTVRRGMSHTNSKLTDDQVRAIRAAYAAGGVTQTTLSKEYGVSLMLINGIVRRTRWSHVTDEGEIET